MPDILFQDGKQYYIEPPDRAFEFQDNGDRWGNTMIRFDHNALTVEEVLQQIAPQHLEHTIAVQLNGRLTGLQKHVDMNSSLRLITLEEPLGREIAHYIYAFLISNYVYEVSNCTAQIVQYQYDSEKFCCKFKTNAVVETDGLYAWLVQKVESKTEVLFLDQYQKSVALERYPSIVQPYSQMQLDYLDEFDFLELSALGDFALPAKYPIRVSLAQIGVLAQLKIEQRENLVTISGVI
ncbi:MAG: hypothetical protein IJ936_00270 [Peptococcaceae bacterium]|nr:hypothetical protein [Peptococcaceae bacterium]